MRKVMLGLVMVMMLMSLVGCGETKKEGFTPNQVTETPSGTEEVLDDEIKEEIDDVANGDLKKYYDVEKYVGTPTIVKLCFGGSKENGYYFYDRNSSQGIKFDVEINDETNNLKLWKEYECIVCDNNTPNDVFDDVLAYVFIE